MPQPAATSHAPADALQEVERLRAALERQSSCLMRVALDGTMLAVSDAALSLLGAQALAEVLETSLLDHIDGDAATLWTDFVTRVLDAGSGSAECEMSDLEGARRAIVLQGITPPPHPDGVDALLITFRDVSTSRRLEASLLELSGALNQLKAALGTAIDSTLLAQQVVDRGRRK